MNNETSKPCLALMGEFSAGKTTLANLLIGSSPLPVRIVATQLPPVMISHGSAAPYSVDIDGNQAPIDFAHLEDLDINRTLYLQLFSSEDFLTYCDLLDMPGISDPNMLPEVWERMIGDIHGVLWCSHAVQAWRQSEAAVWGQMPVSLHEKSILLLTQIDKVDSAADRTRIINRVGRETAGLFRAVLPISLKTATEEKDDFERWSQSGANGLVNALIELLNDLNNGQKETAADTIPGLKSPDQPGEEAQQERVHIQPRRVRAAYNDSA